jgi:hypothetical protein
VSSQGPTLPRTNVRLAKLDAKAFYGGPWFDGIIERYGMKLQNSARGTVDLFEVPALR